MSASTRSALAAPAAWRAWPSRNAGARTAAANSSVDCQSCGEAPEFGITQLLGSMRLREVLP